MCILASPATQYQDDFYNLGQPAPRRKTNWEQPRIYHPFGKPGAGAPLKDVEGNIITGRRGQMANMMKPLEIDYTREELRQKKRAADELHLELQRGAEEQKRNREAEASFRKAPIGELASLIEDGKHHETMDNSWGRAGGGAPKGPHLQKFNLENSLYQWDSLKNGDRTSREAAPQEYIRSKDWSHINEEQQRNDYNDKKNYVLDVPFATHFHQFKVYIFVLFYYILKLFLQNVLSQMEVILYSDHVKSIAINAFGTKNSVTFLLSLLLSINHSLSRYIFLQLDG
ncbi:hypothetical protein KUTeg_014978 [Tegillarca granosa]|uniref:Uncharacterized protein n=1 Tax=Tegillarca granosa TaxID=220873 RepID=A0ABQ9ENU8_TEGGR|nr:hypothetical protein KUTeg_014978 [Tegillarca granosa]